MVQVRLDRIGRIPFAGRQAAYRGYRLAPRPVSLRLVQEVSKVGIGIDNADQIR
jgi:hypothetical protein